jgi:hypothetical protein
MIPNNDFADITGLYSFQGEALDGIKVFFFFQRKNKIPFHHQNKNIS